MVGWYRNIIIIDNSWQVGVIHLSDKSKVYLIPTSPLSHDLGESDS